MWLKKQWFYGKIISNRSTEVMRFESEQERNNYAGRYDGTLIFVEESDGDVQFAINLKVRWPVTINKV